MGPRKLPVRLPRGLRQVAEQVRRCASVAVTGRQQPTNPENEPLRAAIRAAKGGKEPAASEGA